MSCKLINDTLGKCIVISIEFKKKTFICNVKNNSNRTRYGQFMKTKVELDNIK